MGRLARATPIRAYISPRLQYFGERFYPPGELQKENPQLRFLRQALLIQRRESEEANNTDTSAYPPPTEYAKIS